MGPAVEDLILAHVADLGGPDDLSEAQISICRRVSTIECELEAMEARMSEGQPIDVDQYGRLAGRLAKRPRQGPRGLSGKGH
jgi:hypothetical protein